MSRPVRLSKPFYLVALLGLHAGVAALAEALPGRVPGETVAPLFFPAGMVLQAAFLAVLFFFWYRAWKAVYSPGAGFTPAARILKLLIPVYHIYWCFPAFWGWPKRYNEYLREKNVALPPVKGFVFFIFSLLFALSIVSVYVRIVLLFLGYSGGMETPIGATISREVVYVVIMAWIIYYVCGAVNRLPAVDANAVPQTPLPLPPQG
jgi:hypothetical protein